MNRDRAALEVRIENRWLNMAVQVRHLENAGPLTIAESTKAKAIKMKDQRRKDVRPSARKENFWQKFPEGVRNN